MSPVQRFEEAIRMICERHDSGPHRARKLGRIREAIMSYRSRINQAYLASRNTWERTLLRQAGNRLHMMLEEIRILCDEKPLGA